MKTIQLSRHILYFMWLSCAHINPCASAEELNVDHTVAAKMWGSAAKEVSGQEDFEASEINMWTN